MLGSVRFLASAALITAVGASAGSGVAQTQQQLDWCIGKNNPTPDLRIGSCTAWIQSGKLTVNYLSYVFTNRGLAYSGKSDNGRAIADYDQAIRLNPKDDAAFNNRGNAYFDKKDYDRAIANYSEAIRLDPKYAPTFDNRGSAYFDKKDYDRAIADYSEAIRLDPEYVFAFNNRCWVRAVTDRDLQQALADCTQSLRVKPNSALAFANRGFVHLKSGDFDEAIADYDVALRISPTMAVPLYGRGLAKQKKGDTAGGDIDIAAASAIMADIAEEYARYGVKTNDTIAAPPIPPPSPVQQSMPSPVIPKNNDSDEDKSDRAKAKQLEATPN